MDNTDKDNPPSPVAVMEKQDTGVSNPEVEGAGNEPPGPPTRNSSPAGEPDPSRQNTLIKLLTHPWEIFRHPEAKSPGLTVLPGGQDDPGPTEGGPGAKPPITPSEPTGAVSDKALPKAA